MAKTILGKLIIDRSISRPFAHPQGSTGTSKLNSLSPDVFSSCYAQMGLSLDTADSLTLRHVG